MTRNHPVPAQLSGVGATALPVAYLRARESRRADRLFDDPHARHFLEAVDPTGSSWASAAAATGQDFLELMAGQVAVRTRFLDDALLDAAGNGCGQVVLLACGMDTRAFRLSWPAGTRVFELDFADVLAFRNAVLAQLGASAGCDRVEVATDLREDWPRALTAAGFDPNLPTAWLAEGILYALPADGADLLLERVTAASAPGSTIAVDHAEDSALLAATRASISPELLDLWRGGPDVDLDTWFTRGGWHPAVHDIADVAARHQRPTPPAFDPDDERAGRGWLATAHLRTGRR